MLLGWAPLVAAILIILGVAFFAAYKTTSGRRWHRLKIKDEYLESFIYIVMLALAFWLLKNSGWWSQAALRGMYK